MKLHRVCAPMIGAFAIAGYVQAQPPDVVKSDANFNTAMGLDALYNVSSGTGNTAAGVTALGGTNSGSNNTAFGLEALVLNTIGDDNSAFGANALAKNTGNGNTAVGFDAMFSSEFTESNTAVGYNAMYANTLGYGNTAVGAAALYANNSGNLNTALGSSALVNNIGSYNIAIGQDAGLDLTTGEYNIDIGNEGVSGETETIRIGKQGRQMATYMAGIYGTSVSGNAVVVNSSGQLGVVVSSERFKTDIAPMRSVSDKLLQLRPVTFHLKSDSRGNLQYGLIAEEVAQVYPDLVIRDASGRIDGVRYDELAPMLLNEVQQQAAEVQQQQEQIAALLEKDAARDAQIHQIELQQRTVGKMQQELAEMRLTLSKLQPKDELVARR